MSATSTPKSVKRTTPKKGPAVSVGEFLSLKQPKGELLLNVDGKHVSLTHLERVYWPDEEITKFDLLCYYLHVSRLIMPFLKDRPAILQRWPRGVNAPMFFQQDLESAPAFIKVARLTNQEGRELDYAVYTTTASLLHFVNLGTIEQHPWHSPVRRLSKPDWIAIDLYLPLKPQNDYELVAEFARLLAAEVAQRVPKIATVERTIARRRTDQVYVDSMQNARGKSLAAVYTARAKPKATVSMPLTWQQVENGVRISDFTIKNVPELIDKKLDPWKDFFESRQGLKL